VIHHPFTDFLTTGLTGRRWHQTYLGHFSGPFRVVVAAPTGIAIMGLPNMYHLMAKCLADFHEGVFGKIFRIYRQFIYILALLVDPSPDGRIPHHFALTVISNDDFRQLLPKEFYIKVVKGF